MSHSPKVLTLPVLTTEERRLLNRAAGRHLRELRGALGLSQLLFSIELGISVDSVQNYEAGDTTVPAWVLLAAESRVRAAAGETPHPSKKAA